MAKRQFSTDEFIKKSKEINGDKYDYSLVEYNGCKNKVKIICKKHGIFEQMPYKHLNGHGCPICSSSHLENNVKNKLDENNIKYIYQCNKNTFKWLNKQSLDFYLPEYNIAIECQGEQHYKPVDFAGKGNEWAEKRFEYIKRLDDDKHKQCLEHNIKMLYVNKNNFEENIKQCLNISFLE